MPRGTSARMRNSRRNTWLAGRAQVFSSSTYAASALAIRNTES